MYIYIYVYMYVYIYIYMYSLTSLHHRVCVSVCLCVSVCVCVCLDVCCARWCGRRACALGSARRARARDHDDRPPDIPSRANPSSTPSSCRLCSASATPTSPRSGARPGARSVRSSRS